MIMEKLSASQRLDLSEKALELASTFAQDYLNSLNKRSVAPSSDAIDAIYELQSDIPDKGVDASIIIEELHRLGSPATVATAGARYFGLVVGGSLPACVGSRTLSSAWDQLGTTELTSPITAHLERIASDWLLNLFDLPDDASVGFVTGTTMGNFVSLAAARHHLLSRLGWNVEKQGLFGAPKIRVLVSQEVHFTVKKVLSMLGLGTDIIETMPVDSDGAVDVRRIPRLDSSCLVLTQAGNVNSGAIDPIGEIARLASKCGAWVHVDGAFGLWAAASANKQHLISGFQLADSWVTDGHKWLNTPYDCGIAICRHASSVHNAMATTAPYFVPGKHLEAKDMMPELSRAARGIDVWAALKNLGKSGVQSLVDRNCDFAQQMADGLRSMGFSVLNKVVLNQVVATYPGRENDIEKLAAHVVDSGEAWFGVTHWQGKSAFRISFSSWVTTPEDVMRTISAIAKAKNDLEW